MGVELLGIFVALRMSLGLAAPPGAGPGIVVEKATPGFEAEKAGLQPGDVLVSWSRGANPPANPRAARGVFRSPFDVPEVFIDQAPRAKTLTLAFVRGGKRLSASIAPYPWRLETRPRFAGARLDLWEDGRRRIEQGDLPGGLDAWRRLASALSSSGGRVEAAWVWSRVGRMQAEGKQIDAALSSFEEAAAEARAAGRADVEAHLLGERGDFLWNAPRPMDAQKAMRDALAIRQRLAPDSLAAAQALFDLARVTEYLDPEYEPAARRALEIRERLAPGSGVEAASLGALARAYSERGDLRTGRDLQQRALAIHEKLDPGSRTVATTLSALCAIDLNTGDLASAQAACDRSLALWNRLGPNEPGAAIALHNLATVARKRGDLDRAGELFRQALAIREKTAPVSRGTGWNLYELALVEMRRGNLGAAEQFLRRSREVQKVALPPGSPYPGMAGVVEAQLTELRGDLPGAASRLRQAVEFFQGLTPDGAWVTFASNDLGRVLMRLGETAEAEREFRRVLAIRQRYAPQSRETAESSHNLGLLLWKTGRLEEAEVELRSALDDLEAQLATLGGVEETRTIFAASFSDFYKDYLNLLVERRREEDAFLVLERFRAGAFLRKLAERDLAAPREISPDLDRERRLLGAEYERTQAGIRELRPREDGPKIEEALARLADVRRRQEEVSERIRRASPKYAALRYPKPSDAAAAREALDPGTLLLSYAVGRDRTILFAVSSAADSRAPLSVFTLPVGEAPLRESVEAFRRLLERNGSPRDVLDRGRSLAETLLGPAAALIAKNDRLLIVPDGPLQTLPWAALVRDAKSERPQYLVESKSIHTAASATVYAELRGSRKGARAIPAVQVKAFGDPRYPFRHEGEPAATRGGGAEDPEADVETAGDAEVAAVLRGGRRFEPLPRSRQEVEAIAALYAPRSESYVGAEATEERARSVGKDVPLIHYACHAYVNERFPLDSALVFTIPERPRPGQENGLLQVWEIFESVRIDADLVTLSACDSGLGKETGGEGLIGLTRAFQYAGARSVLASLWKVEDESTARLMKSFYGYLKAGNTKDESLRLAQIQAIRSRDFAHPGAWAGFQLAGDWK